MRRQMSLTRPGRSSRGRLAVGLVLSTGLLLSATACGGEADAGSDVDDPAVIADAEISVMKVCQLIDLAPLLKTMKTEYATGPTDISKGVGVDPAGPQCYAQVALPKLRSGKNSPPTESSNAGLNVAAMAYHSAEYAATEYDTRIAQVRKHLNAERTETPLTGAWTKGVLINGRDLATDRVYALVRKDSYLVKIELSWQTDARFFDKFPFTRGDVASRFQKMMVPFYAAVSAKAGG